MAKEKLEQDPAEPTMASVMARLADIAEQNNRVQRQQLKQTAPRSHQSGHKISVFNPRGEKDFPMPPLKCEVHMPFPLNPSNHGMDREEVELMNLVNPGEYQIEKNDGELMTVNVIGRRNHATGDLESMFFSGRIDPDTGHPTPFVTRENRQQFASLRVMLRQILGDKRAFRDDELGERLGRDDSPALAVMSIIDEKRGVDKFRRMKPEEAEVLPEVAFAPTLTAGYKGPLAISVGE